MASLWADFWADNLGPLIALIAGVGVPYTLWVWSEKRRARKQRLRRQRG